MATILSQPQCVNSSWPGTVSGTTSWSNQNTLSPHSDALVQMKLECCLFEASHEVIKPFRLPSRPVGPEQYAVLTIRKQWVESWLLSLLHNVWLVYNWLSHTCHRPQPSSTPSPLPSHLDGYTVPACWWGCARRLWTSLPGSWQQVNNFESLQANTNSVTKSSTVKYNS